MSQVESTKDQEHYNQVAIKFSKQIEQVRATAETPASVDVDNLFPDFNRTGLGVFREYERMGNQPVSDQLQAKASEKGIEFEHLGLTIGTVLHNIDLSQSLSPDIVELIRATLLERKVIFVRDQNLSENEHETFGRYFGDLDAFPFGRSGRACFNSVFSLVSSLF